MKSNRHYHKYLQVLKQTIIYTIKYQKFHIKHKRKTETYQKYLGVTRFTSAKPNPLLHPISYYAGCSRLIFGFFAITIVGHWTLFLFKETFPGDEFPYLNLL